VLFVVPGDAVNAYQQLDGQIFQVWARPTRLGPVRLYGLAFDLDGQIFQAWARPSRLGPVRLCGLAFNPPLALLSLAFRSTSGLSHAVALLQLRGRNGLSVCREGPRQDTSLAMNTGWLRRIACAWIRTGETEGGSMRERWRGDRGAPLSCACLPARLPACRRAA